MHWCWEQDFYADRQHSQEEQQELLFNSVFSKTLTLEDKCRDQNFKRSKAQAGKFLKRWERITGRGDNSQCYIFVWKCPCANLVPCAMNDAPRQKETSSPLIRWIDLYLWVSKSLQTNIQIFILLPFSPREANSRFKLYSWLDKTWRTESK